MEKEAAKQRLIEKALLESEATLKSIFRTAPTGIGMVADRVIKQANKRLCEMTGYSREELLGKSARILYPTDEDFAFVGQEKYKQIREQGTGTVETHWKRKDGKVINVLLSSTPIDLDDLSVGVTFNALDITERKQAEEALRESEQSYRSLFKNNHSVMLLIDPNNADIVDANPTATSYYGWSHEELTRKKITNINTLTEEEIFQEMEKAKSEQRRYFVFQHRLANGDIRDVEVYSGPIKLRGKQLLYSIIHDITDRIQAEKEREKLINELRKALKEITTLRGILPLCSFCKKIRDDKGYWEQVDVYIHKHSQADISHGICPECAEKHYPFLKKE